MTLPNERFRAIKQARDFLFDLLDPKKTPRVPKAIRREARWRLKHYPLEYNMDKARERDPETWGKDD